MELSHEVNADDNGDKRVSREAVEAMFRQRYGDLAENIIDDVDWSSFGY